jgi:hypothetical protein
MRHLPIILSAVLASVGLLVVSGQAHAAMPALSIDRSAVTDGAVEKAGYYYRRCWGYHPHYYGLQALLPPLWLLSALWLLRLVRQTLLSLPLLASGAATDRGRWSDTPPALTLSALRPCNFAVIRANFAAMSMQDACGKRVP